MNKTNQLTPEQLAAMRAVPLVAGQPNRLRVALAMTNTRQVEVSKETGLTAPVVSDFVNGNYTDLNVETARKLATFFGCQIEDLFPGKQVA